MADLQAAKALVRDALAAIDAAPAGGVAAAMAPYFAKDMLWRGMHPFDEQTGPEAVAASQ